MRIFQAAFAGIIAAGSLLAAQEAAQATPFLFNVTGGPPGPGCSEACAANAVITPGVGMLTVVLNDTQANPRSAGDLLSGIEIALSGSLGAPTLQSQSGQLITVKSTSGPYTTSAGPPNHWGVGTSAGSLVLETAGSFAVGGKPINMVIGPPNGSGNYSNANSSIDDGHFSPYINGTGTFVILDSAITPSTTITGVKFNFGTKPDTLLTGVRCASGSANCGTIPSVPEPSALALVGGALVLFGLMWRRRAA